jgi:hypothetical protein
MALHSNFCRMLGACYHGADEQRNIDFTVSLTACVGPAGKEASVPYLRIGCPVNPIEEIFHAADKE